MPVVGMNFGKFVCGIGLVLSLISCGDVGGRGQRDRDLGSILRNPDPTDRNIELIAFFEQADGLDLPEIKAAYVEAMPYLDFVARSQFAVWWTRIDPTSAYNEGLQAGWGEPTLWGQTVFREWSRLAPDAAIRAAKEIPTQAGPDWKRVIAIAVVHGIFDGDADPKPLLPLIEQLPTGRPQKETLDNFFVRLVDRDGIDGAIAFVDSLPTNMDRLFRKDAFKRFSSVLAQVDQAQAIAWAEKHADAPYGKFLLIRAGRIWARQEGEPALDWAIQIENPAHRVRVLQEAFTAWARRDPAASSAWVDRQGPLPELDSLRRRSIMIQSRKDPTGAIARLPSIQSDEERDSTLIAILRWWRGQDAEAAQTWREANPQAPEIDEAVDAPLLERDDSPLPGGKASQRLIP